MDRIDRRIVALLQANARLGYQELGEAVGLSAPAAYQRVKKLEARGVISGYHARVDSRLWGRNILAFVRVQPGRRTDVAQLETQWDTSAEILECHRVSGTDGYLLKVRVGTVADLVPHLTVARRAGCAASVEIALDSIIERWTS